MPTDADVYLCGPDAFLGDMRAALTAQGVPAEHVASEVFGTVGAYASGIVGAGDRPAPHPPDGRPGTGPTVSFVRSNVTVGRDAPFPSLLDLAEACDVPVGFGCRNTTCHTARAPSSPARSSTPPTPSNRRRPGASWCAAARRTPTWRSTSEATPPRRSTRRPASPAPGPGP